MTFYNSSCWLNCRLNNSSNNILSRFLVEHITVKRTYYEHLTTRCSCWTFWNIVGRCKLSQPIVHVKDLIRHLFYFLLYNFYIHFILLKKCYRKTGLTNFFEINITCCCMVQKREFLQINVKVFLLLKWSFVEVN